jgi:hypothetical protein
MCETGGTGGSHRSGGADNSQSSARPIILAVSGGDGAASSTCQ